MNNESSETHEASANTENASDNKKVADQKEPLAIIGMGLYLPFAENFNALKQARPTHFPLFGNREEGINKPQSVYGHQFSNIDRSNPNFSIPPIFRKMISDETYIALQAVDDAMTGLNPDTFSKDTTDVFCGTCLGFDVAYNNAVKIKKILAESNRLKETGMPAGERSEALSRYKNHLKQQYGATSHDKVGEMASSIPARIAHHLSLRGKCQTLDAFDHTGITLLELAEDTLLGNDSDQCLLVTSQCFPSNHLNTLLANKGYESSEYFGLTEGAVCLVVKTLRKAVRDGDSIITCVRTDREAFDQAIHDLPFVSEHFTGFSLANHQFLTLSTLLALGHTEGQLKGETAQKIPWTITFSEPSSEIPGTFHHYPDENIHEDIAIVGYAPIMGSCISRDAVWQKLCEKEADIRDLKETSLSAEAFLTRTPQKLSCYNSLASYLDLSSDLDRHLPFTIMPKKREAMDDVQKVALIAAHSALKGTKPRDRKRGGILGSTLCLEKNRSLIAKARIPEDQMAYLQEDLQAITFNNHTLDGLSAAGTAETIAKYCKLNGSCSAVEAACASSLAALHNAVRALQSGRLDMAVTGGFELPCNEKDLILCSAQMMLSANQISPFSDQADGFTPGDGGAIFVLKRLSTAQKDGDRIHGVIRGISGSCDAKSMTAPDPEGQALAMKKALSLGNIDPLDVQYVEAHGTGTLLGDAAETSSIRRIYRHHLRQQPLIIGSAKYHFGHCFAGAGSVGLSKVLLSFDNDCIPPTPLKSAINPDIQLEDIPADINQQQKPWKADKQPVAALNSFGTGGINYHLVITKENP